MNPLRILSLTCLALALSPSLPAEAPPHIVLVMADDQGWGDMAYNGHPTVHTPNFDRAATNGIRFDRFYAAAPVCSPTRASVMTGRHPFRSGVFKWGYPIRPQEITLAEALKSKGYTTGHFGKWHLGSVRRGSPASPGAAGFDRWVSAPNFYDNDAILSDQGEAIPKQGESSMIVVEEAVQWMRQVLTADAPIFSVIWFGSPHGPHVAAPQDRERYAHLDDREQNFLGEITGMDRAFGRLNAELESMGIRDNTLVWYCSDNGALPRVGSTGGRRGNKGSVYEGGLLVPAFIEWPARFPHPGVIHERVSTSDILPTILDIVGAKLPKRPLDGVSLAALLENPNAELERGLGFWSNNARGIGTPSKQWMGDLFEAQQNGQELPPHPSSLNAAVLPSPPHSETNFEGHSAWIEGDWKLHRVENAGSPIQMQLYNLKTDPNETDDLVESDSQRAISMRSSLDQWLRSVAESLNGADY